MKKVSFTEMKKGSKEDYLFLDNHEQKYVSETAERILKFMSGLTKTLEGYQVSRLEHSLQSATRAYRAGESEEMVVATLLHDIGDELAPMNHSEYKYKDHKYYQATVDFCEKYDQSSFDPNYKSLPLSHFEPMVKNIFSRKPYSHF